MRRLTVAVAGFVGAAAIAATAAAGSATTLCVGGPHCYATIQAAVDASHDGDTILVNPGTYAGGVVIDRSVSVVGVRGAAATIVKGGGPVIEIGEESLTVEPNVSLRGLTITGGDNESVPNAWDPFGGGVFIAPPLGPNGPELAGTDTISDSVITGNKVTNSQTVDFGIPCPGGIDCPGAAPQGGGIASWGNLTLTNTTVSDNVATTPDFYTSGGGIQESQGFLTLDNSSVVGNSATATAPFGLNAQGGGIAIGGDETLTVRGSHVDRNTVSLANGLPYAFGNGQHVDEDAHGGGVTVDDGTPVTFDHSTIDGNSLVVNVPNGEPFAYDSGMCVCGGGPFTMRSGSASGNVLTAQVGSTADTASIGGALESDGPATISDSAVVGNRTSATSRLGEVEVNGELIFFDQNNGDRNVVTNTLVSGNVSSASGPTAHSFGAGIVNNSVTDLRSVRVIANVATATGPAGFVRGGGIYSTVLPNGPGPLVSLSLENSLVSLNVARGSTGITSQGGGLYAFGAPVSLDHSVLTLNLPDNCFGC
jgi:hypothetical protein